ncbi:hypothetical protein AB6A40_007304 [Gnathostoma spinigerum]|uniref:G-protein coupled receptors family 2 profile 2 domain-containing protein n=1 Tax=Gnathostoma spinigerum TaxID=75299 RepID=A0ABD6EWG2_9BILA
MLAEGVYLYRLLLCAFSQPEALKPYFIACWGFPAVITVLYSICRLVFDNEMCWVSPSRFLWIESLLIGPCLLALIGNLFLMLIILFILIKKLRFNPHLEPVQYRKAVRAVFMLMPVFGLHFLFTIYRIPSYLHQIFNLVLDGLQGFVVSIIVCYTNGRVHECLKKTTEKRADGKLLVRANEQSRNMFLRRSTKEYAQKADSLIGT